MHLSDKFLIRLKNSNFQVLFLWLLFGTLGLWIIFGTIYLYFNVQINNLENRTCISTISSSSLFNFKNWSQHFLFAMESSTTIGYGGRHPEALPEQCWKIHLVQLLQPIVSLLAKSIFVLLVYGKLTEIGHTTFYRFLNECCIFERNKRLCLVVRMASNLENCPNERLIGVEFTGKLLKTRSSIENEWVELQELELHFGQTDFIGGSIPVDFVHYIDSSSPLYEISKEALESPSLQLELICKLSATVQSTGQPYTIMKSYSPRSMRFGYRFETCIEKTFTKKDDKINYIYHPDRTRNIIKVLTDPSSQEERDLEQLKKELLNRPADEKKVKIIELEELIKKRTYSNVSQRKMRAESCSLPGSVF